MAVDVEQLTNAQNILGSCNQPKRESFLATGSLVLIEINNIAFFFQFLQINP